jgi:hypothetical protein
MNSLPRLNLARLSVGMWGFGIGSNRFFSDPELLLLDPKPSDLDNLYHTGLLLTKFIFNNPLGKLFIYI